MFVSGHDLNYPTMSFTKVTEYAARSFKANGFKDIVLIGDSGGKPESLAVKYANSLNKEWAKTEARVHFIFGLLQGEPRFEEWLQGQGERARRHRQFMRASLSTSAV